MRNIVMLIGLCLSISLCAQSYSISDIQYYKDGKFRPMVVDGKTTGYYYFYAATLSSDKKNTTFTLQVFDEKLTPTKQVTLVRPSQFQILDIVFIETGFVFAIEEQVYFPNSTNPNSRSVNKEQYTLEIHSYTSDLKPVSTKKEETSFKENHTSNVDRLEVSGLSFQPYLVYARKNNFRHFLPTLEANMCYNLQLQATESCSTAKSPKSTTSPTRVLYGSQRYEFSTTSQYVSGMMNPKMLYKPYLSIYDSESETPKTTIDLSEPTFNEQIMGASISGDQLYVLSECFDKTEHTPQGYLFKKYDLAGKELERLHVNEKYGPAVEQMIKKDDSNQKNNSAELLYAWKSGPVYYLYRFRNDANLGDLIIYEFDPFKATLVRKEIVRDGFVDESNVPSPYLNKQLLDYIRHGETQISVKKDHSDCILVYNHGGSKSGKEGFKISFYSFIRREVIKEVLLPGKMSDYRFHHPDTETILATRYDVEKSMIELHRIVY